MSTAIAKRKGGARPGAGRKKFVPTDNERATVLAMKMCGLTIQQIAHVFPFFSPERKGGVAVSTVGKYFRNEIEGGMPIANARVVATAYRQAASGDVPAMTMFWLKTQLGWNERVKMDLNANITTLSAQDLAKLTDTELETMLAVYTKLGIRAPDDEQAGK